MDKDKQVKELNVCSIQFLCELHDILNSQFEINDGFIVNAYNLSGFENV